MEDDPVLARIGDWGRWQATKVAAFSLVGFFFGWHMLAVNLLVPEQEFWCAAPDCSCSVPGLQEGERPQWADVTFNNTFKPEDLWCPNVTQATPWCPRWDYDRSSWPETVVSEFHLVCDREYLRSLSQSVYMAGIMLGSLLSGLLSDRFGRKRITVLAAAGLLLSGSATALAPSMLVFTLLRFLVAIFSISTFTCGFCYCMEIVGGRAATIVGIGLEIPWSFAYMLLPLVSWLFPRWQHLQLAVSLPVLVLLLLLLLPRLTTESPRWLLSRGRIAEATVILDAAARTNGRAEDGGKLQLQGGSDGVVTRGNLFDLFKTRGLLRSTLIMYYLFFTNSFVYYGLTLNSGSFFPGDIHLNIIISGVLEIIANILTIFALIYFGRRLSVCISMAIGGVTLFIVPLVGSVVGKATLAQIGRFAITGSFSMVFIYAVELFPTVIRNVGLGSASVFARVGGILAPYIGRELGKVAPSAPLYIFGVTSVLAAILVLLLPETKGVSPPSTVEEGERFNWEQGGLRLCRRATNTQDIRLDRVHPVKEYVNDNAF